MISYLSEDVILKGVNNCNKYNYFLSIMDKDNKCIFASMIFTKPFELKNGYFVINYANDNKFISSGIASKVCLIKTTEEIDTFPEKYEGEIYFCKEIESKEIGNSYDSCIIDSIKIKLEGIY